MDMTSQGYYYDIRAVNWQGFDAATQEALEYTPDNSDYEEEYSEPDNKDVLDQAEVEALPLVFHQPHEEETSICVVCMEDLVAGDAVRYLQCFHKFHSDCIDTWLTKFQALCPVCKISIHIDHEDEATDEEEYIDGEDADAEAEEDQEAAEEYDDAHSSEEYEENGLEHISLAVDAEHDVSVSCAVSMDSVLPHGTAEVMPVQNFHGACLQTLLSRPQMAERSSQYPHVHEEADYRHTDEEYASSSWEDYDTEEEEFESPSHALLPPVPTPDMSMPRLSGGRAQTPALQEDDQSVIEGVDRSASSPQLFLSMEELPVGVSTGTQERTEGNQDESGSLCSFDLDCRQDGCPRQSRHHQDQNPHSRFHNAQRQGDGIPLRRPSSMQRPQRQPASYRGQGSSAFQRPERWEFPQQSQRSDYSLRRRGNCHSSRGREHGVSAALQRNSNYHRGGESMRETRQSDLSRDGSPLRNYSSQGREQSNFRRQSAVPERRRLSLDTWQDERLQSGLRSLRRSTSAERLQPPQNPPFPRMRGRSRSLSRPPAHRSSQRGRRSSQNRGRLQHFGSSRNDSPQRQQNFSVSPHENTRSSHEEGGHSEARDARGRSYLLSQWISRRASRRRSPSRITSRGRVPTRPLVQLQQTGLFRRHSPCNEQMPRRDASRTVSEEVQLYDPLSDDFHLHGSVPDQGHVPQDSASFDRRQDGLDLNLRSSRSASSRSAMSSSPWQRTSRSTSSRSAASSSPWQRTSRSASSRSAVSSSPWQRTSRSASSHSAMSSSPWQRTSRSASSRSAVSSSPWQRTSRFPSHCAVSSSPWQRTSRSTSSHSAVSSSPWQRTSRSASSHSAMSSSPWQSHAQISSQNERDQSHDDGGVSYWGESRWRLLISRCLQGEIQAEVSDSQHIPDTAPERTISTPTEVGSTSVSFTDTSNNSGYAVADGLRSGRYSSGSALEKPGFSFCSEYNRPRSSGADSCHHEIALRYCRDNCGDAADSGVGGFVQQEPQYWGAADSGVGGFVQQEPQYWGAADSGLGGFVQQEPQYWGAADSGLGGFVQQEPQYWGAADSGVGGFVQQPQYWDAADSGLGGFVRQEPQYWGAADSGVGAFVQGPQYWGAADSGVGAFLQQGPYYWGAADSGVGAFVQGPQYWNAADSDTGAFAEQGPQYWGAADSGMGAFVQGPQYWGAADSGVGAAAEQEFPQNPQQCSIILPPPISADLIWQQPCLGPIGSSRPGSRNSSSYSNSACQCGNCSRRKFFSSLPADHQDCNQSMSLRQTFGATILQQTALTGSPCCTSCPHHSGSGAGESQQCHLHAPGVHHCCRAHLEHLLGPLDANPSTSDIMERDISNCSCDVIRGQCSTHEFSDLDLQGNDCCTDGEIGLGDEQRRQQIDCSSSNDILGCQGQRKVTDPGIIGDRRGVSTSEVTRLSGSRVAEREFYSGIPQSSNSWHGGLTGLDVQQPCNSFLDPILSGYTNCLSGCAYAEAWTPAYNCLPGWGREPSSADWPGQQVLQNLGPPLLLPPLLHPPGLEQQNMMIIGGPQIYPSGTGALVGQFLNPEVSYLGDGAVLLCQPVSPFPVMLLSPWDVPLPGPFA